MNQQSVQLNASDFAVPAPVLSWQTRFLGIGVVGLVLTAVGWVISPEQFFRGYLMAYMLWVGLSLGCLGLLMVQYLSGGLWGLTLRRFYEAGAQNLWLMLILFVPIAIGRHHLYEWMTNPSLTLKSSWYLTEGKWFFRLALYFVLWLLMTVSLSRRSRQQDERPGLLHGIQGFSGVGLVVLALTVSFAAVDWIMSLDPTWGSTIYGLIFLVGQGLSALCFGIIMLTLVTRNEPFRDIIKPMQFHDIGKLTLALVMVWAYFSFSQWLIIWSGNLPDEISWYLARIRGPIGYVALFLIFFHFVFPFLLLLSRERKRAGSRLIGLAIFLICMRFVDIYWYTVPNFAHTHNYTLFHWTYIVAPIGIGGLWLFAFFYNLRQRPLLPIYEPQMPTLLHQGSGHGH